MARRLLVVTWSHRDFNPSWYGNQTCKMISLLTLSVFFFLEETSFPRDKDSEPLPQRPKLFVSNRIATFFPGTAVIPRTTFAHLVSRMAISKLVFYLTSQARRYITPFKIALSPLTIIVGFFVCCVYGFAVGLAIVVSIFLQSPEKEGGYGFTPNENAECAYPFKKSSFGSATHRKASSQLFPVGWPSYVSDLRHATQRQGPAMDITTTWWSLASRVPPLSHLTNCSRFSYRVWDLWSRYSVSPSLHQSTSTT